MTERLLLPAVLALAACNRDNTLIEDDLFDDGGGIGFHDDRDRDDDLDFDRDLFDLTFTGDRYDDLESGDVIAGLLDLADDRLVDRAAARVVSGRFGFFFDNALERGRSYALSWFADVDGDGLCGAADEVWSQRLGPVDRDVRVNDLYDRDFDDGGCDLF